MPVSNASSLYTDSDPYVQFSLGHAVATNEIVIENSPEIIVIKIIEVLKSVIQCFCIHVINIKPEVFFRM